jgi:hypothetical protein
MFRSRMVTVRPMIGMVMEMTWLTMFQGSHLNLKKTSHTKNE